MFRYWAWFLVCNRLRERNESFQKRNIFKQIQSIQRLFRQERSLHKTESKWWHRRSTSKKFLKVQMMKIVIWKTFQLIVRCYVLHKNTHFYILMLKKIAWISFFVNFICTKALHVFCQLHTKTFRTLNF